MDCLSVAQRDDPKSGLIYHHVIKIFNAHALQGGGGQHAELSGYHAKRHEFEPEYDQDAELMVSELEFWEADTQVSSFEHLRFGTTAGSFKSALSSPKSEFLTCYLQDIFYCASCCCWVAKFLHLGKEIILAYQR